MCIIIYYQITIGQSEHAFDKQRMYASQSVNLAILQQCTINARMDYAMIIMYDQRYRYNANILFTNQSEIIKIEHAMVIK